MSRFQITKEEYETIKRAEKETKDKNVSRRLQVLMQRYEGYKVAEIAEKTGMRIGSISQLSQRYREQGLEEFARNKCLMYLGRNLVCYGLNPDTVADFCYYADEKIDGQYHGSIDPEYLAGKVPLARWLRKVKKEIRPDFWSIWTRYDGNVKLREITTGE